MATGKDRMSMTAAMEQLRKNSKKDKRGDFGYETLKSITGTYRYIDFWDPKFNIPCLGLEWLWGARGLLCGRMMKIEAEEGTGKSSYLMLSYAMGQKTANAWCVHEESEGTPAPPDFVASFGADPDNIVMPRLKTRSIEGVFSDIDWTTGNIRSDIDPDKTAPIIVGVDSISGFGADDNMDDEDYQASTSSGGLGVHSRVVSKWFRDRGFILEDRDVLLLITAQWREKISTGGFSAPGDKKKTTIASRPLNFHASYRVEMYPSALKDSNSRQIGETVHFTTTKNKISPKGRHFDVDLYWDHGFDLQSATCDLLKKICPIILPNGQTFDVQQRGAYIGCPLISDKNVHSNPDGKTALMRAIYAEPELLSQIRESLRIRGFGFAFEEQYTPSAEEVEDLTAKPDEDDA